VNAGLVFYGVYLVSNTYKLYFYYYDKQISKQNEELTELNEQKNRLFSIIAHDLRGPLAGINQFLNMMIKGKFSADEQQRLLEKLSYNAIHTSELLDNLLNWSRSQLDGFKVNPVRFELNQVVRQKIMLYHEYAQQKRVVLNNTIVSPVMVYADKDMIEAVLRNLISNAIKFCKAGDKVVISAEYEQYQVKVCVADTGLGMSREDMDALIKRTYFTRRGTTNEKGTGLGLVLCKDFVEKNGGYLRIESEYGKGTKVFFTIPSAGAVS
jgi:two-component system sensor histidine kinase/response regulator